MLRLSRQQWFNNAWERAKIEKPAQDPVTQACSYFPINDAPACFIGISLDKESLETKEVQGNFGAAELVYAKIIGTKEDYVDSDMFLSHLQDIHDQCDTEDWTQELLLFAKNYGLEVPE